MNGGALALAFVAGAVATINPCGFALLPAYLSYFLGLDDDATAAAPGGDAATGSPGGANPVLRALAVSAAVTLGFVVVFGTFLATSAWNYALGHMESAIAGIFLYVQPVVAAIGGIALLDERLTWPLLLGGALIILGVAIAQFGPLMQKRRFAESRN